MKPTNEVWAKFQSVGHPESTQIHGPIPIREMILLLAKWTLETTMGSKLHIVVGRNRVDLDTIREKEIVHQDMMSELVNLMAAEQSTEGE